MTCVCPQIVHAVLADNASGELITVIPLLTKTDIEDLHSGTCHFDKTFSAETGKGSSSLSVHHDPMAYQLVSIHRYVGRSLVAFNPSRRDVC